MINYFWGGGILYFSLQESIFVKFLQQFRDPLISLLLVSALASVAVGSYDDAFSITLAIVIVSLVAFIQEYRSEKSLEQLNKLMPLRCRCLRDGNVVEIYAKELVPGDIVKLTTGDKVPADLRLLTTSGLEIDESSLTGEMHPVSKHTEAIPISIIERIDHEDQKEVHHAKIVPSFDEEMGNISRDTLIPGKGIHLADRLNSAFMGTLVRAGNATAIVIGTGKSTEFGALFSQMQDVQQRRTPLQVNFKPIN